MKVLLIYPYFLEERIREEDIRPVPIGLYSVATVLRDHGYDGDFIHHTGHPVGNSWGIMLTSNTGSMIREGMAFALEPGLYDRDMGGIRIEDNVYVTKGGAVNMMDLPRVI